MEVNSPMLTLLLTAVCLAQFLAAHSEHPCTKDELLKNASTCEDDLLRAIIKGGNCSKLYTDFVTCVKSAAVACHSNLPKATTQILVDASMGLVKAEQFYCSNNALHINITAVPAAMKSAIGCKDAYFTERATCANEFRKVFTANAASSKLCGLYTDAQQCDVNAAKTHCNKQQSAPEKTNVFCSAASATATAQPLILLFHAIIVLIAAIR